MPAGFQTRHNEALRLTEIGVAAAQSGDTAAAIRAFDSADDVLNNGRFVANAYFGPDVHAIKAQVYNSVGRTQDALREARIAFDFVNDGPEVPKAARDSFVRARIPVDYSALYGIVVGIFKTNNEGRFSVALTRFKGLVPKEAHEWTNRGAVLADLGEFDDAVIATRRAATQSPREPLFLNNHCYVLVQAGRAQEGLPFCERAARLAPNISAIRHSYGAALAKLGRCSEANEQNAISLRLNPASASASKPVECTLRP